jgi:probable HAF family extracellular repeat protein
MKRRLTALLATAVIASPLAYGDYQLSPEVPPPGSRVVTVYAANSRGYAIGTITTTGNDSQPVFWATPSTPEINSGNLGGGPAALLGLAPSVPGTCGYARDKRGVINAVMGDNDEIWPLSINGVGVVPHIFGVCNAIRDDDIGVGEMQDSDGYVHAAFWWNPGGGTLGDLGGHYSSATAISSGPGTPSIAGFAALGSGHIHATFWKWYRYEPVDLGTLNGAANSYAYGISDSLQIVGSSEIAAVGADGAHYRHATLWPTPTADAITDLGTLPNGLTSLAKSINSAGQIVGQSDAGNGLQHAVLWGGGKIYDLNQVFAGLLPPNVVLTDAPSIASNGLIQVNGHNTVTGELVFYQAKPVTPTTVVLVSSLNPSSQGQTVTFTATIRPVTNSPITVLPKNGSVIFRDDGKVLAKVSLFLTNVASYSTKSLTMGRHAITASYSGFEPFQPADSPTLTQSVILKTVPQSPPTVRRN